jgi:hypothetical protein
MFPGEVVASCSSVELNPFLPERYYFMGQLNPLLPERTWCGLPFYFLHLAKLPKNNFLFINFIHGKTKKLKNKSNLEPFG